jgi:hypothetical protein
MLLGLVALAWALLGLLVFVAMIGAGLFFGLTPH